MPYMDQTRYALLASWVAEILERFDRSTPDQDDEWNQRFAAMSPEEQLVEVGKFMSSPACWRDSADDLTKHPF